MFVYTQITLLKRSRLPDAVDPDFRIVPERVRGYGERFGTLTLYVRTVVRCARRRTYVLWPKTLVIECTRQGVGLAPMFQ
jgi:hypothetical protein